MNIRLKKRGIERERERKNLKLVERVMTFKLSESTAVMKNAVVGRRRNITNPLSIILIIVNEYSRQSENCREK